MRAGLVQHTGLRHYDANKLAITLRCLLNRPGSESWARPNAATDICRNESLTSMALDYVRGHIIGDDVHPASPLLQLRAVEVAPPVAESRIKVY